MPHDSNRVAKHALGAVAGAAIPAVVLGSLAVAPAQATQVELAKPSALTPKNVSPETLKVAEDHIKAHLLASRIPTLGLPAQRQTHEVKVASGDSLWSIAREYDTTVAQLKKINSLDSDILQIGQKLKLSGSTGSKSTAPSKGNSKATSYTVKDGDTLGHIALSLDASLTEVRAAAGNPAGDRITIGQKLNFGSGNSTSPSVSQNTAGKAEHASYTVKSGDTLGHIAQRLDLSLASVRKAAGNPAGDRITVGQKLNFSSSNNNSSQSSTPAPEKTSSGSYTVKSGDTLGHIAQRLDLSLASVRKAAGNPAGDRITVGQKLNFGSGNSTSPSVSQNTAGKAEHASYTVKSGDTLGHIAQRLNLSLASVRKAAGNPAGDRITVGQKLNFSSSNNNSSQSSTPAPEKTSSGSYTVKSGDTLGGIALQHGMSLNKLMSLNNLTAKSMIFPGNTLKTAGASDSAPAPKKQSEQAPKSNGSSSYTVQSGDTLGGIAAKHGMSLSRLLDLNPQVSAQTPLQLNTTLKVSGSSVQPNSNVKPKQEIGNTFLGRTYPDATVSSANENKNYLNSISVPSKAEMQQLIRSTAQSMGVDPALALAHAHQESGFDMRAVSPANAIGAMQVIPSTGEWMSSRLGRDLDLLNPKDNVAAGIATMRYNLDNTDNIDNAIASYYQGLGGVRKYGMYSDTKTYVASVKAHMKLYR